MNDLINIEMNKNQDPVVSDRRLYKKNWIAVVIPDGCKQVFITDDKEFFNEQLETGGMVSLYSGRINEQDTSPEVCIGYRKEIITQAPNVVSDQGIPAPLVHSIAKQDTLNDC